MRPSLLPKARLGKQYSRVRSESSSSESSDEAADDLEATGGERQKVAAAATLGDSASCRELLASRAYLASAADDLAPGAAALDGSTLGGPNDIGERFESLCDAPLHSAARSGGVEMTQLLLAARADADSLNVDRATPVHVAARYGHADVLALLLGTANLDLVDADRLTPLHHASCHGHAACVRLLLDNGATCDSRDSHVLTPLHHAASLGHVESVRCLLQAEPQLMVLHDEFMDTPVIGAVRNGHVATVAEFLSAGLDVNATDAFATTLLQLAAFHGQYKMVRYLLINGASVDGGATSKSRLLAMHLAAMSGDQRCVGELLEAGANLNAVGGVDSDGGGRGKRQTPLHFAAQAGHAQCVTALLSAGADADARDFQQHTARELAALESHEQTMKAFDIHAAEDAEDFQPQLQQLSESGKGTMVPKTGGRAQARREGRSYGASTLADEAVESNMSIHSIRAGASR
jgi:ankyrin repeat protein